MATPVALTVSAGATPAPSLSQQPSPAPTLRASRKHGPTCRCPLICVADLTPLNQLVSRGLKVEAGGVEKKESLSLLVGSPQSHGSSKPER